MNTQDKMKCCIEQAIESWGMSLNICYPAEGDNGSVEANLVIHLGSQLIQHGWGVWAEFPFRQEEDSEIEHFDCVALDKKNRTLWIIEAKRFYDSGGATSILSDIKRARSHWKKMRTVELTSEYDDVYCLALANAWGSAGRWWKLMQDENPSSHYKGKVCGKLRNILIDTKRDSELVLSDADRPGDDEYFCWAMLKISS